MRLEKMQGSCAEYGKKKKKNYKLYTCLGIQN